MMMGGGISTILVFFGFFLLITLGGFFGVHWIYQQGYLKVNQLAANRKTQLKTL